MNMQDAVSLLIIKTDRIAIILEALVYETKRHNLEMERLAKPDWRNDPLEQTGVARKSAPSREPRKPVDDCFTEVGYRR